MEAASPKEIMTSLSEKKDVIPWICYYGSDHEILSFPDYKLFVLEADAFGPIEPKGKNNRLFIAYMSIGEIAQGRWFWPMAQDRPWLLDENTAWGSMRVDPRNPEWQQMLIEKIAPRLLAAGYDGFMLDNVDIGEYLENLDTEKYAGASDAIVEIICKLRKSFPSAILIANGGLATAANAASCLDAVLNESAFSTWYVNDSGTFSYREVSAQDKAWLRPRLLRIRGLGLPVLSLEYADPENVSEREKIYASVKKAGMHPYIAERSLMQLPPNGKSLQ